MKSGESLRGLRDTVNRTNKHIIWRERGRKLIWKNKAENLLIAGKEMDIQFQEA